MSLLSKQIAAPRAPGVPSAALKMRVGRENTGRRRLLGEERSDPCLRNIRERRGSDDGGV